MANGIDGTLSQQDMEELEEFNSDASTGLIEADTEVLVEESQDPDFSLGEVESMETSLSEEYENMDLLLDVKMNLVVEIGRTKRTVDEVLSLCKGAIVELDKSNGELVDVVVNNRLVALGEVVAVDESYGVRIVEVVNPKERLKMQMESMRT